MADFSITEHGPLFDGSLGSAIKQAQHEAQVEVARVGEQMVRNRLGQVLRHPTGYYKSHVRSNVSATNPQITDGGVIYGPWLEGTGSRNRTTRFKGYSTFRRTVPQLQARADAITDEVIARRIGGM